MFDWLLEPFSHQFMRTALLASLLVSATCSLLGVYVVLRRMAFLSEAVAHTTLPGLVIAYFNQWSLLAGAILAAICTALSIGWLSRGQKLREDTAIGIVYSGMFALGIVLISRARNFRDFTHQIMFGNVLGVTPADLLAIAIVCLLVCGTLWLISKELLLTTLDPLHARAIGLSSERIRYVLLVLLALAIVTAIQSVGVVLTTALMVTPAATASLVTHRLSWMFCWSITFSFLCSITGLYLSYYYEVSAGAAIVLACTGMFGLIFVANRLLHYRRGSATTDGQLDGDLA